MYRDQGPVQKRAETAGRNPTPRRDLSMQTQRREEQRTSVETREATGSRTVQSEITRRNKEQDESRGKEPNSLYKLFNRIFIYRVNVYKW